MKRYERYKPSGIEWIGEIPEHWNIVLLKRELDGLKDGTHGTYSRTNKGKPLLSAKNVYFNGIKITDNESLISEEDHDEIVKSGYPQYGDLLLTIVGTIGRCFVYNLQYPLAFQRSVLFLRFKKRVSPKYYFYFFQSPLFSNRLLSLAKTSAQSGVYMNDVAESIVLELPKQEQTGIASYLDQKTTEIDDLIAKKYRFIDLLNEEKTAIINQAVTKGLNPDTPMTDSGIPWLGEIPAHWEVKKLKYVARLQSGDGITSDLISEEGPYPVFGGNGLRGYTSSFTHEGDYVLIGRQGALCGNINYASGRFWASEHAIVATACGAYVCLWFGELLRTMNLNQYSQSAAQPGLSVERIQNLFIPVPPLEEQRIIAHLIETSTKTTDAIISKIEKEISLLQEYRTALISEAVTGKIDVHI